MINPDISNPGKVIPAVANGGAMESLYTVAEGSEIESSDAAVKKRRLAAVGAGKDVIILTMTTTT